MKLVEVKTGNIALISVSKKHLSKSKKKITTTFLSVLPLNAITGRIGEAQGFVRVAICD